MFSTVLAMEVCHSDLLQKNELWGHNWLTGLLWHSPRPHCPRLLRAIDTAQQGCQGRTILLDVELLRWTAQDCVVVWSSFCEILLPYFFLFSQIPALLHSPKIPRATRAPLLFILQSHFPRVALEHLILHQRLLLRGLKLTKSHEYFCYYPVLNVFKFLLRSLLWLMCFI